MHQLGNEEKAALLLASADDEEINELKPTPTRSQQDNNPVISRRPRTYQRNRNTSSHPVLFFILILCAFIFGCLTGVVILLYRLSQQAESSTAFYNLPHLTQVDLTIQTKIFQSIAKKNFSNFNQ